MRLLKKLALGTAIGASLAAAAPASALTIVLNNTGGVEGGTAAYLAFHKAALFWSQMFTNNVTVNLNVGFRSLGPGGANILGQTGSSIGAVGIRGYEQRLLATASGSGIDALATTHLPGLNAAGALKVITPGYFDPVNQLGVNALTRVYDTDSSFNNRVMGINTSVAKAVGYNVGNVTDGTITFNSDFAFDLDPTNGITPGQVDFTLVAIHEIGHALGFTSGVDDYDFFGCPRGPACIAPSAVNPITGQNYNVNNDWWGYALDMFRYSPNATGLGGGGPKLDWSVLQGGLGNNPYFSIDGGATALFGNLMSRGQFNGRSFQASHWRYSGAVNPAIGFQGIMDPVGTTGNYVTALDIAAFDAIGWNTRIDALAHPDFAINTAQIFGSVPEPASWAMMIAGFGFVGAAYRRRKTVVNFANA